jgi:glycosyltransferase involved in cell wall biosynthesis
MFVALNQAEPVRSTGFPSNPIALPSCRGLQPAEAIDGSPNASVRTTMRVVHVLHSMAIAGAEVLVRDFVLHSRPGSQAIVTLDAIGPLGESLRAEGVHVECVGRRPGIDLGLPVRLAAAVRRLDADVVHAHQYTPYFYSALATRLSVRRPALVFTEHGRHVPDHRRPKRVAFNRVALGWTDRVTAVCAYVKRLLVANEGIGPDRVDVIYNGVDASRFSRAIDRGAVRRKLGYGPDERVVVCVARFHAVKDHPTLLRGFARAYGHDKRARLLLVGSGDGETSLRALARETGVGDVVRFAGVRDDVPDVLAGADLFAMTSLSEGTSVTILEAMLARMAAVVTDTGGNPEIVEHERTGLLVPVGDDRAVGDAIARLLGDPARAQRLGEAARERALAAFSQERMHEAWWNVHADAAHVG